MLKDNILCQSQVSQSESEREKSFVPNWFTLCCRMKMAALSVAIGGFSLAIASAPLAAFVIVVVAVTAAICVYIWVNGTHVPRECQ